MPGDVPGPHDSIEFCSILNHGIRNDWMEEQMIDPIVQFVQNMNQLCVPRRVAAQAGGDAVPYPTVPVVFRGASLPDRYLTFYEKNIGNVYRVPGFLATSFVEATATEFLRRRRGVRRQSPVLYRVHLDPRGQDDPLFRCQHVNLLARSDAGLQEHEFLFEPYAPFRVRAVHRAACTQVDPYHVIDLEATLDGKSEAEDAPLAPFY